MTFYKVHVGYYGQRLYFSVTFYKVHVGYYGQRLYFSVTFYKVHVGYYGQRKLFLRWTMNDQGKRISELWFMIICFSSTLQDWTFNQSENTVHS